MTDRDAFGRPIAGQGPSVQPLGSPGPGLGPSGSGPSRPPRRQGSGLRRMLWWFVAFDLIAIIVVALLILRSGDDTVVLPPDSVPSQTADGRDSSDGSNETQRDEPDEPATKDVVPAGFNSASLLRPDNLEHALDEARALHLGKPLMVRVEASRVDLQLARPNGALVIMQIAAAAPPRVVTTVAGAARSRATMPWAAIEPASPQRLARATNSTRASGSSSTAYVVFLEQTREWVLYRKDGRGYIADANGRGGTRIPGT